MVDVFEKEIECRDALSQAILDLSPFLMRDDPREQIVRKNALGAFVVSIDSKGDALMQEREIGGLLALAQFFGWEFQQTLEQRLIVRPRHPRGRKHFIVGCVELIVAERRAEKGEWQLRRRNPVDSSACSGANGLHP